ncbi:uncharacterized protein LOC125681131 [Ostrea edulis]|uniref:uncharacterized protein LOC125681131 n=1 Tax=Ostrea edulis TaxID=37623 RepID=UPI0024AF9BEE|nr:uncharacterized protein LOC125681131 [Ostrea edulis]
MKAIHITLCVFLFFIFAEYTDSCRHDSECQDMDCPHGQHHYCYFFRCHCRDCSHDSDCHCSHGQHPHCSHHSCGCYDCTEDSHCTCSAGFKGTCLSDRRCSCEAVHTTTTTTTTTTTPLMQLECSHHKVSVIESIAENLHVEDSRAAVCPGNNKHQSSEAFVIHKCNSTKSSLWTQGSSMRTMCKTLHPYTPIATFFDSGNNMAGFFIECTLTGDGLKIAAQTCNDAPMIMMLNETTTPRMSDFYTINQHV